jgi:hypothetical protein
MQQVNIHEAKTNLSRLIDDVEHGEEVISRATTGLLPDHMLDDFEGSIS